MISLLCGFRGVVMKMATLYKSSLVHLTLVCDPDCPSEYEPLCSNNERTYVNECFMNLDACLKDEEILRQYEGQCRGITSSPQYRMKFINIFQE